ncbi:MAG: hypothetical protein KIT32_12315 [Rhodocyclaceae bacterium]|nr:hypothetical protein [Rhodocyclaceae bacterium]
MATYLAMQNRISDEAADVSTASASIYESQIQSAILSAIVHYEREPFYFNETTGTFSTVANQEYYSSSDLAAIATLVRILSMNVTINSVKLPIKPLPFETIDDWQNGLVKNFPSYYCYYKENIRFYPIPDAIKTITMAYIYRLTALSAGTDTNAWTTDAEELIRARAKADLLINVKKVPEARAEMMEIARMGKPFYSYLEQTAFNALKRESRMRRSISTLRVEDGIVAVSGYNINTD